MGKRRNSGLAVALLAVLAAVISALAPLAHGLVHPDHEIVAALSADHSAKNDGHGTPGHQGTDCALYQAYVSAGAHAAPPSIFAALHVPYVSAYAHEILPVAMPAGAPRGIALGRGPPLQS